MNRNRQIAIIIPDTLQQLGLQCLLSEYFPLYRPCCFSSLEQFSPAADTFDFYITDADSYLVSLEFFLLRRNRTFVIVREGVAPAPAPLLLPARATMETLIETLQPLLTAENTTLLPAEGSKELSSREIDVLQEIVRGSTNREIAEHLSISLNTVLSHRKNITAKLGIKTVSGLTFYAIMNGIISGEEIDS